MWFDCCRERVLRREVERIVLPDGGTIQEIDQDGYRYLGVLQAEGNFGG